MSLTLKIQIVKIDQLKAMKFAPTMSVSEVLNQIKEKSGEGGEDHGLFQPALEGKRPARWLRPERTLQFYDLRINDVLEYKKKHRPIKVKLMDDTIKTIIIDDSLCVSEIVDILGKKMAIKNSEEFSLKAEGDPAWLQSTQCLAEQGVGDDTMVILQKKYFVDDANISRDDPVQLHLVYVQSRDGITTGSHPCTYEEAIQFAALQCQIQLGNHNPTIHKPGFLKLKEYLPPSAAKNKNAEKDIYNEYRKFVGTTEINSKYRYVQLCRSLKTYGITFFQTKERVKGQKKPVAKLLGITRDAILRLDGESKEVEHEYPLSHLKRWAASPASFTLDFGDYEEDYVSVITNEGESISQLLAGYIDILLKKRKDTGVVLDENDNDVATVETVGRARGQASSSLSSSTIGGYDDGKGNQSQFSSPMSALGRKGQGMPLGPQVNNVDQAQTALANIVNDMDATPLPAPQEVSGFTPQQWKEQLLTNAKAVNAACGKLNSLGASPQQINSTALNTVAKEVAVVVDQMVNLARNATASMGEDPDGEMPLLDSARSVADALARVMKATKEVAQHPNDPKTKDNLRKAHELLGGAMNFLNGAASGQLADLPTTKFIAESARAVYSTATALTGVAKLAGANIEPSARQVLLNGAAFAENAAQRCMDISHTLAPAVLDANCKKAIIESCNAVKTANAQLLASAKNNGVDPGGMEGLHGACKVVSDAVAQLLAATEVAEPRGGVDPEFTNASKIIGSATNQLMNAQGDPTLISAASKAIAEAIPTLLAGAKRAVLRSDDDAEKTRLLGQARSVGEAAKALNEAANHAANKPDDVPTYDRLLAAARTLAGLTSQLVGDAGKQAHMQALRVNAKSAAAETTALIAAARNAVLSMPDDGPEANNLLAAAKAAADAITKIMQPLTDAQKSPDNQAFQSALLEAAKNMAPMAYKLVAGAKLAVPHIGNRQQKQDLVNASNIAGAAVKELVASASGLANSAGEEEFDTATENLQAVLADIESAELFATQGMFEGIPGQSREEAQELLNVAVRNMGNAARNIAGSAKSSVDKLGPTSKELASAVQQCVYSTKALAGCLPSKAAQKTLLGAAKQLASTSEVLVGAARALASSPKDPSLGQNLAGAAKSVADALVALLQTSKGTGDQGSKDLEEAITSVANSLGQLNDMPIAVGGDFPVNADRLLASTKAVSAAVAQLLNAAKNNPTNIGGAAKTCASTVPTIVSTTNAAAGSAPKPVGQALLAASKGLVGAISKMLQASRAVAAKPGDREAETLLQGSAKGVSEALKNLMSKIETGTPAQKEVAEALEAVAGVIENLQSPTLSGDLNAAPLEALKASARALVDATAQLLAARETPDKVAANAKKSAASLGEIVDYSKLAAAAASGQSGDELKALSDKLKDTCNVIASTSATPNLSPDDKKQLIAAAKEAALAVSGLVGSARTSATNLKTTDPDASKAIITAAQAIATASQQLVNFAKQAAAGTPANKLAAQKAKKDVDDSITKLLGAASSAPSELTLDLANLSPGSENLLAAAKAIATATQSLLESGKTVAGGSKDPGTFTAMSNAAKSVTGGIQALLNAANSLKPGQKELEDAIEAIQNASVDLDSAALNAAIGMLENTAPAGATLQKSQDELVDVTKELAKCVVELVTAAKSSPDKLGPAAQATGTAAPKLANAAKQCAGLMSETSAQQDQITAAKNLEDALLDLLNAAKSGNMAELGNHAKSASQAITAIISPIKPGVVGSKDCDDAIAVINGAASALANPAKTTKSYPEHQTELGNIAKALVASINQLTSAAKTKPEEIGPAAKKIATVIPQFVEQTRLAGAASTDADARAALINDAREVVNATAGIISDAKAVSADKKNPQLQQVLSNSFKAVTQAVGNYVNTLKSGPSSERDIDNALEDISRTMADLDSAALFAAAGQLEADNLKGQSLESCQNALLDASKAIATACSQLVNSAKGSPEQLGGAAKSLAKNLKQTAGTTKTAACLAGDSISQQTLLTAARAASIAGQQLVLSARQAQKTGDVTSLSGSAQSVSDSVKQLLDFLQMASADASKGIIELDNAAADIRKLLTAYDTPSFKGNPQATAEDIIKAARAVAESTAHLVAACNSNPDEIYQAAKNTSESTKDLLENSKGASRLTDDKVISGNLLESAKAVANATNRLLGAAKTQRSDTQNPAAQQKLSTTSGEVVDKINDVVSSAGDLPGGERAKKLFAEGENLEEIAEKELLSAAAVIEEATAALLSAKKRAQDKRESMGIVDAGINEAILDAARAIAQATQVLVSSATQCQKEIVASGKATKTANVYRRDPTWARGLISAAQSVAGAVQTLVQSANDSTQGKGEEEQLVASARGVAAATARLVAASRAKADPMSSSQQKLSNAAKAVATATSQLVAAAKAASEENENGEDNGDVGNLNATGQKVVEMEAQVKILKLRKELEKAQENLFKIRKSEYDGADSGAPAAAAAATPAPAGKPAPLARPGVGAAKPAAASGSPTNKVAASPFGKPAAASSTSPAASSPPTTSKPAASPFGKPAAPTASSAPTTTASGGTFGGFGKLNKAPAKTAPAAAEPTPTPTPLARPLPSEAKKSAASPPTTPTASTAPVPLARPFGAKTGAASPTSGSPTTSAVSSPRAMPSTPGAKPSFGSPTSSSPGARPLPGKLAAKFPPK